MAEGHLQGVLWRSDVFRVHLETLQQLDTIQVLDPDQEEVYKVPLIITKQHLFLLRPQCSPRAVSAAVDLTAQ